MDTFYAVPTSTSPLTPRAVIVEDIITPIIPAKSTWDIYPRTITSIGYAQVFQPSTAFRYDSGIGENLLARSETNTELRYNFLDSWLYKDYPDILRMMKIVNGNVQVLSADKISGNDISKDSEEDLEKKSDFIADNILTKRKNMKILDALVAKYGLKYYDLPYNKHYVKREQAKYVKRKLKDMAK